MSNEIDEIFGDKKEYPNIPSPKSFKKDVIQNYDENSEESNHEYDLEDMVAKCKLTLDKIEIINEDSYNNVKKIISKFAINVEDASDPYSLSLILGKIQSHKDGLVEIVAEAQSNYILRKRMYELLFDAFSACSTEKTVDKRKGDATLRLREFSIEAIKSEAFFTYCKNILDNVESQHKTISRRLSAVQMQIQIGELSTGKDELDNEDNYLNDSKE